MDRGALWAMVHRVANSWTREHNHTHLHPPGKSFFIKIFSFPGGSDGKESSCNAGDLGSVPELGRSLAKGTATHSSILAWRIPWTEEPGRL